ncbi:hypothetical protein B7R22_15340 [Subtercola boreus]|uniref:Uncharacterized protein n=1 Tax=Subtercola boreus TaxID=120213 RepID=A0A3E0VT03_9MICO|nr:hypothetical protein B7R22_15340 [Subtercola boreus]
MGAAGGGGGGGGGGVSRGGGGICLGTVGQRGAGGRAVAVRPLEILGVTGSSDARIRPERAVQSRHLGGLPHLDQQGVRGVGIEGNRVVDEGLPGFVRIRGGLERPSVARR